MPFRKKRKTRFKRRRTRRSKRRGPSDMAIGWQPNAPSQRVIKHRYVQTVIITSTTGILNEHVFRANSMFDPDFTSTGHQPMGFDQMALLYNHYTVLGSKIKCQWNFDTAQNQPFYAGTYLHDNSASTYTTSSELIEARRGSHVVGVGRQASGLTSIGKFSAKRFFNVNDVKDNLNQLSAVISANPADLAYFTCWYENQNGVTNTMDLLVIMDFITLYHEPRELVAS